jgi:hypothetical protein
MCGYGRGWEEVVAVGSVGLELELGPLNKQGKAIEAAENKEGASEAAKGK